MGKTVPLTSADLDPQQLPQQVPGLTHMRQRGVTPSAELDGLNFKLPAELVQAFNVDAAQMRLKKNELFTLCYRHFKATYPGAAG